MRQKNRARCLRQRAKDDNPQRLERLFGFDIILPGQITQTPSSSQQEEPVLLKPGDSKLWSELGTEKFLELVRARPIPREWRARFHASGQECVILASAQPDYERAQQFLTKLYRLLSKAVLLPIRTGLKKPTGPDAFGWPTITYEETLAPEYQARLLEAIVRGGNIGVRLGPLSQRLIALDIDDKEEVPRYIKRFPWLSDTLRSQAERGCQFWLRLEADDEFPNSKAVYNLKNESGQEIGELRLGGAGGAQSIIWGLHPHGMAYELFGTKVVEISLADLYELCPELGSDDYLKEPEVETTDIEEELDDEEPIVAYPEIGPAAFHGPFGEIVRSIELLTEADPAAVLAQLLVGWGNLIERGPFFAIASDLHFTNLNCCIVGKSGRARKGISLSVARWILGRLDPDWEMHNIRSGLSSGEGLIWQVRDPIVKNEPVKVRGRYTSERQEHVEDEGVTDKRLLIAETEFGSALTVMGRTGNTLSGVVRDAFDAKYRLGTLVKNSPAVATEAHISIIGHITGYELRSRMKECEQWNGFSNRFLWVCAKRHGVLPTPKDLAEAGLNEQLRNLVDTTQWTRQVGELERDEGAEALWCKVYRAFAEDEEEGIVAATIDRGDTIMLRLSMIYALADGSRIIRAEHVAAAEALWKYAEASAYYLFGNRLGNPKAERIFEALRQTPQGLTRRQINDGIFKRHVKAEVIDDCLNLLLKHDWITRIEETTGGRPAERFYAKKTNM